MPGVLANEFNLYLFYFASDNIPGWNGTFVKVRDPDNDLNIACITFENYRDIKFGGPNDEAISGHPLAEYGLQAYSFQLVENSPWIEERIDMNKVHPLHSDSLFDGLKHYIYFFHDSCYEVLCKSYTFEFSGKKNMKEFVAFKLAEM